MTAWLFFVLVLFVATLPFVPAFREMRLHRDASPLTVSRRSRVDVRHFANGLRDFLTARIGYLVNEVESSHTPAEGCADGVGSYLIVPPGAELSTKDLAECIVVGVGSLDVRGEGWLPREIYSKGHLSFPDAVRLRAALAEDDLDLGAGSTVLRWAHAGRHLIVGENCQIFGRASADEALFLRLGTTFERIHAPAILVGDARPEESGRVEPSRRLDPEDLARPADIHARRALVRGDARIPDDVLLDFDVVSLGDLVVGSQARVLGNLKAHGRVIVEEGAWLEGSVVATQAIEVRDGAYVHGPILSEEELSIRSDARVGDPDRPTTARARRIEVSERARIHGTLWASSGGEVVSA